MKRLIFIFFISCTSLIMLHANQRDILDDASYKQLVNQVESTQRERDSIDSAIVKLRERYMRESLHRNEIAQQLSDLEQQAIILKYSHEKALAAATAYEQQWIRKNIGNQQPKQNEEQASAINVRQHATIHNNKIIKKLLTTSEIASLRRAESKELGTVDAIKEYLQHYDKMVMLQLEYERTEDESKANSIASELEQERSLAKKVEENIEQLWQSVIDNKNYIYNLVMEKDGHFELVTKAESMLSIAVQQCNEERGSYESDVLASYYRRKLYMLGYEEQVAKTLNLTAAKDSLQTARTQLVGDNYLLPTVRIKRRAFITYEPLKVIKPTIYNYKNPIPSTKVYEYGTIFRIRIGIFTNRPNLSALRGITPLSYTREYHNGKNAYFVGGFRTLEEAREGVAYLRKIGFRDPIPVVWVNGKYYSNIEEWQKEQAGGYNIEISGLQTLPAAIKTHISQSDKSLQISRIGGAFVIGTFTEQSAATKMMEEIIALEGGIKCEINELKNIKP